MISRKGSNVTQINNKGVQDLFSEILFPPPADDDDDDDDESADSEIRIHIQKLLEESSRILEPQSSFEETSFEEKSFEEKPTVRRLLNSAPDGVERFNIFNLMFKNKFG